MEYSPPQHGTQRVESFELKDVGRAPKQALSPPSSLLLLSHLPPRQARRTAIPPLQGESEKLESLWLKLAVKPRTLPPTFPVCYREAAYPGTVRSYGEEGTLQRGQEPRHVGSLISPPPSCELTPVCSHTSALLFHVRVTGATCQTPAPTLLPRKPLPLGSVQLLHLPAR